MAFRSTGPRLTAAEKTRRISLVMLAGFGLLFLNLLRMQVFEWGAYRRLSEKNRIRVIYLEGARGRIYDRAGKPLADNRLSFNCSVMPRESNDIDETCGRLAPLLGETKETLLQRFGKSKSGNFNTVILAEDIGRTQAMAIEERLDELPGVLIETRPQREYPLGPAAAHLVGYIGPLQGDEESRELYDYSRRDWVGANGVEKMSEGFLRGRSGGLQIEVNSAGRIVKALGIKEPETGKDIQLTVDAALQSHVQSLLHGEKGAVIVMDLKDGSILSFNSSPSFDPNRFASSKGRKSVAGYLTGADAPMVDRGTRGQYPPGSIYKIVTALAALKRQKITPETQYNCPGFMVIGGNKFHCWKLSGHGEEDLTKAFADSCDVYFYSAGLAAGVDAIVDRAKMLGLGRPTGLDLPGERSGLVPDPEWKRRAKRLPWFDGDTANLSIGQGFLQLTPIQALMMISAVATNGEVPRPHLVEKVNGVKVSDNSVRHLDVPAEHWKAVQAGLDAVVNSPRGTGRLAKAEGVRIAGKTGTAQSGQSRTHAWFVGYAPAERPKVAMVVFLENGGTGGVVGAKMASNVFEWLRLNGYL